MLKANQDHNLTQNQRHLQISFICKRTSIPLTAVNKEEMIALTLLPVAALLCLTANTVQGVEVEFGEVDYREIEGVGGVNVVVQKQNKNFGDLILIVQTIPYSEIDPTRKPADLTLPDPAEHDLNGRQDFVRTTKTVTFPPSVTGAEQTIFLEFLDDDINEEAEGYFAVLSLNESASDPRDVADFGFIRTGVTSIVIQDDDEIQLAFSKPSYTVDEANIVVENLISVVKVDDRQTEQELEVFLQLAQGVGDGAAEYQKDFEIAERKTITFTPDQQSVFVPFEVFDDDISEFMEQFDIVLAIPVGKGVYNLGSPSRASTFIKDDEIARVGFRTAIITVGEGDSSVNVCAEILEDNFDFFVIGSIQINSNASTATAGEDFTVPSSFTSPFFLNSDNLQQCFNVTIIDDEDYEGEESISLTITFITTGNLQVNFDSQSTTTTIVIADREDLADPCSQCGPNGECGASDIEGLPQCVCKSGYRGDGIVCNNIDECAEGLDTCHTDAVCTDTDSSYSCTCKQGFTGDGVTCVDIDECAQGLDHCHTDALCINTHGGYRCECKTGYTGSGFFCGDIDECAGGLHRCHANAQCINTRGGYRCECKAGYTGNGFFCGDIDECALGLDRCHEHAVCTNTRGGYTCECRTGFTGDGFNCQDIDECAQGLDRCHEHAVCTNTMGGYTCECRTGFTGDGFNCQDIDECALGLDRCHEHAVCTNTMGGYTCECRAGFTGDGFNCQDIDECAQGLDRCHEHAMCTNTRGGYTCECRAGFTGDGFNCQDLNECRLGTHNCGANGICTNTIGSFTCSCVQGYRWDGNACLNINECAERTHDCDENAYCIDQPGGYLCRCKLGYEGDGFQCKRPVTEPATEPPTQQREEPETEPEVQCVELEQEEEDTSRSRGTSRTRSTTRSRSTTHTTQRHTTRGTKTKRSTRSRSNTRRTSTTGKSRGTERIRLACGGVDSPSTRTRSKTPRTRGTPRGTPRGAPRGTPSDTTPRGSTRGTPRGSTRGTPRSSPRP